MNFFTENEFEQMGIGQMKSSQSSWTGQVCVGKMEPENKNWASDIGRVRQVISGKLVKGK